MRHWPVLLAPALLLAACTETPGTRPATAAAPSVPAPRPMAPIPGLEQVMNRDGQALIALFGPPAADIREGDARKLQFSNATCVLDAYLYPAPGKREPLVTYVDARRRDGLPTDRAACVAALGHKPGAQ